MRFALPQVLWLLLLVPLLGAFLVWAWRTKERLIGQFVQSRLLAQLTVGVSKTRQQVRLGLLVSAVAFAVLAMARPQWGFSWEEVSQKGLDIVVAIDTSRSMLAADIPPNRLERAKFAALDLMKLAKNDRLGLVAFAGSSFLQCPLTLDEEAFRQSVVALDVNIIPQGGTAIAETIQTALAAFKEGENHKILVLLTDGEDHEDGAVAAAKSAAEKGLRIFTIGIGSADGELIRVRDEKGKLDFLKDDSGNVVKSKLNETLLQQIAGASGGFYLNLRGANTMDVLYERGLAPLPKSEFNAKLMQRYHERFYWPLGIAIVLLVLEMFLPERQKVRRPAAPASPSPAPLAKAASLALLLAVTHAHGSSAEALKQYEAGKYTAALKEYDRLRRAKPEDARLAFNAGAAAYQARQFEDAARHFSSATGARDPKLAQSAFYNLGNAQFQAGDAASQPQEKREAWESAINFYNTALQLRPDDADAKHNREFVQRKLEELKQQQDKQQSKDNQDQKPDDKKDDQNKDQQKKDEQKQDKSGQDQKQGDKKSEEQKKSDEQKKQPSDGSKPDEQKPQPQPGEQKQPEQKKPSEQAGKQKNGQKGEQGDKDAAQAAALGQMTAQQAMQLLDSQRSEERALIFLPTNATQRANNRIYKNW
ncbi:MAG: VWA domain-containing protein [Verrucomicrobia bacterium]|nr:VWA domain-containing protein [Verrucomicrobiota bacterium]NBU08483.1 VWA domain-containing protein [Pseudomonadota bacterium]NDA67036.1 VWA domain-containing protein [Verrucomicrobiota bacterium]NDB76092.1 VWA domain-containing protein [Verrucomicrobiota bacterium]NDD38910.1 VWA domain-containing protein [Verrucomicrobiota bacterium]